MEVLIVLTFVMVWILSGLFVAYLMIVSDNKQFLKKIHDRDFWLRRRDRKVLLVLIVMLGLISLLIGIIVLVSMVGDEVEE